MKAKQKPVTIYTPEEIARIKSTLLNGLDIQFTRNVYVLKEYTRGGKAYMRFFIITGPGEGIKAIDRYHPHLTEITRYIAILTRFTCCRERHGTFWIYSHPTNEQDIIQALSQELFGMDTKVSQERL